MFGKRKKYSLSLVYVLHSGAMTAKKCTAEKRDARAKSLFCLINLLVF